MAVGDVAGFGTLTAEFQAAELAVAKAPPERLLDVGRMPAHIARLAAPRNWHES